MNPSVSSGAAIRYNLTVSPVREVCLIGTADGPFWSRRLRDAGLFPVLTDGRAQLLISAVAAKFLGIRFRELPIAVYVGRTLDAREPEGIFLCSAFSSLRFFACMERWVCHTPYVQGDIELDLRLPASLQVSVAGEVALRAEMSGDAASARGPQRTGPDGFEGPIYLPARKRLEADASRLFHAKIAGHTLTYAFLPSDRITIRPSRRQPIFQALIDSDFRGGLWQLRADAVHAKSKTVARSAE